jgi:hypothetical protein
MSLCSFLELASSRAGVRLRAAAGALFPPKGEEKKSQIEAERHRREAYQRVGLAQECGRFAPEV